MSSRSKGASARSTRSSKKTPRTSVPTAEEGNVPPTNGDADVPRRDAFTKPPPSKRSKPSSSSRSSSSSRRPAVKPSRDRSARGRAASPTHISTGAGGAPGISRTNGDPIGGPSWMLNGFGTGNGSRPNQVPSKPPGRPSHGGKRLRMTYPSSSTDPTQLDRVEMNGTGTGSASSTTSTIALRPHLQPGSPDPSSSSSSSDSDSSDQDATDSSLGVTAAAAAAAAIARRNLMGTPVSGHVIVPSPTTGLTQHGRAGSSGRTGRSGSSSRRAADASESAAGSGSSSAALEAQRQALLNRARGLATARAAASGSSSSSGISSGARQAISSYMDDVLNGDHGGTLGPSYSSTGLSSAQNDSAVSNGKQDNINSLSVDDGDEIVYLETKNLVEERAKKALIIDLEESIGPATDQEICWDVIEVMLNTVCARLGEVPLMPPLPGAGPSSSCQSQQLAILPASSGPSGSTSAGGGTHQNAPSGGSSNTATGQDQPPVVHVISSNEDDSSDDDDDTSSDDASSSGQSGTAAALSSGNGGASGDLLESALMSFALENQDCNCSTVCIACHRRLLRAIATLYGRVSRLEKRLGQLERSV